MSDLQLFTTGLWDNYHMLAHLSSWKANAWSLEEFERWDACANTHADKWNPGRVMATQVRRLALIVI